MEIILRPQNYLVKQLEDLRPNNDVIEVEVITIPTEEEKVKVGYKYLIGKFSGWKYNEFLIIKNEDIIAKI